MNQKAEAGYPEAEREIERLVNEMDRVIEREEPDQRRELRMLASSLINQNIASATEAADNGRTPRSMGILAGGLGLLIIGSALFILLPPIALIMIILGVMGVIWGAIAGLLKKSPNSK